MLSSLLSIFKKEKSGKVAKKRLQMVLIQDRASVSPEVMEKLRDDIIKVISKYMVINQSDMEISLENVEDSVALVANIPVQNMRHQ
ncbi:cell division topological specificity factor MinE [Anaerovibrio slackiae]|uniref:Cell division topological specificity factor n=1 Tax=Anaerovibrio slackiae TaxID=2652309 RepID=A0A6I2UF83_9FIRM|nr:cell division topological specificity factor MinE [Anaerovibrio slackiae]MBR0358072.1 cell division topological specificity factor MinE [Selenomonadaceae bacterium]MCI6098856.1 cell division topological specificity factor MinE [Selenomonadaceae bacterium]MSU07406.1 cell division topological specificity factor MinE [Anaerovibrio slackiae]